MESASEKIGFNFKHGSDNWKELFEALSSHDSKMQNTISLNDKYRV
jgi:hypothetical protein